MKKSKNTPEKMLTDVELELMNILWQIKEGSVADVIEQLPKGRELAYTSVSTMLRILEQKGSVEARKEGRGHVYIPVLKKSDYEAKIVKHVVDKVFDKTPIALVKQLLGAGTMSEKEIQELKRLVDDLGEKK